MIARNQGKYQTKPIEDALRKAFLEESLFGGHFVTKGIPIKVAVVTTTLNGQVSLLSNYNRPSQEKRKYLPSNAIYVYTFKI